MTTKNLIEWSNLNKAKLTERGTPFFSEWKEPENVLLLVCKCLVKPYKRIILIAKCPLIKHPLQDLGRILCALIVEAGG